MSIDLKQLSNHPYSPGRLTIKEDQVCYKGDVAKHRKQIRHFKKAVEKICIYLEENPHLQNDAKEVAAGRDLMKKLEPYAPSLPSLTKLRSWVLQGEWAQGKDQERPEDYSSLVFVKPGEVVKPAEKVHILGHAFAYSMAHLGGLAAAPPNFTLVCQEQRFGFSHEVLVKALDYFRSAEQFSKTEEYPLQSVDPRAFAILCQHYLAGKPMPAMDTETVWDFFDLACYLQFRSVEQEMGGTYLKEHLEKDLIKMPFERRRILEKSLTTLDLSRLFPSLTASRFNLLWNFRLTRLDISENPNFDVKGFALLGQMTTLVHLNVAYSPLLGNEGVRHLSGLTNLTFLDMSGARQVDDNRALTALQSLTRLETLKLNDSQRETTRCLTALQSLPLKNLELRLSRTDFSGMTGLSTLTRLDYSAHFDLDVNKIRLFTELFPSLKELVVKQCTFESSKVVELVGEEQPNLKIFE